MKSTLLLIAISYGVFGQSPPAYTSSFAAVIVSNLESSSTWYQSVLNLQVKQQMNDSQGNYRITVLSSGGFDLELLELKGSLTRSSVLAGKPSGTQIQGHFKIGFNVSDLDAYIRKLASYNVQVSTIHTDQQTRKRNFLITDPDGNLVQIFED
jgi:predicted enzyme related to lactoylglutathione lyase